MAYVQERQRREFAIEQKGSDPTVALDRKISPEELAKHTSDGDCWISLHGLVLDVSDWIAKHPGGRQVIQQIGGKNGTKAFQSIHGGRGPLIMISEEYSKDIHVVGEYDDPNAGQEILPKDMLVKEHISQSEQTVNFIIHGAVDFEEEIEVGKAEVVKVTNVVGPVSTMFVSGQVADADALKRPLKDQAASAVNKVREELEKCGATLEDIVKINAYIVDIDQEKVGSLARALTSACGAWGRPYDLLKMSARSKRYNPADDKEGKGPAGPPAFTWVGTPGLATPNAVVQLEVVAMVPGPVTSKL